MQILKKSYIHTKLKAIIAENGLSQAQVAKAINLTPATLSRKINGKLIFDEIEMIEICNFFKTDVTEIFFQPSCQTDNSTIAV